MTAKCDQKTINVSGRHKSANVSALYQQENIAMHKRCNKALHFTNPNDKKRKKKSRRKSKKSSRKSKKRRRSSVVSTAAVQVPFAAAPQVSVSSSASSSGSFMDQMVESYCKTMIEQKMAVLMGGAEQPTMVPGGTASVQTGTFATATAHANPTAAGPSELDESSEDSESSDSESESEESDDESDESDRRIR